MDNYPIVSPIDEEVGDYQWNELKAALHWDGTDKQLMDGLERLLADIKRKTS